jgi:ketosteroid isomerase-like protein
MTLTYKWITALLLTGALLAGCGDDKQNEAANSAGDGEPGDTTTQETHTASDEKMDTTTADEETNETDKKTGKAPIEEADNVPADEKTAILAVLDKQVESFNNKDVDAYMSTISETPESFDYTEEKLYVQKVFAAFDASMTPLNPMIIKYDDKTKTANVFMNMESTSKDLSTGKEVSQTTRQIMVFEKEETGWKQISLFGME